MPGALQISLSGTPSDSLRHISAAISSVYFDGLPIFFTATTPSFLTCCVFFLAGVFLATVFSIILNLLVFAPFAPFINLAKPRVGVLALRIAECLYWWPVMATVFIWRTHLPVLPNPFVPRLVSDRLSTTSSLCLHVASTRP